MEDKVVLEFDLSFGVRTNDPVLKYALDFALEDSKDEIAAILRDYGVPLVKCSACVVDGDLPAHGTYFEVITDERQKRYTDVASLASRRIDPSKASPDQIVSLDRLAAEIAAGTKPQDLWRARCSPPTRRGSSTS